MVEKVSYPAERNVDHYRSFDSDFFAWRTPLGFPRKDEKDKVADFSKEYSALLHESEVSGILTGNLSADELSQKTVYALLRLAKYEQNPSSMLARTSIEGLNIEQLMKNLNFTDVSADTLYLLSGRVRAHLWRLVSPEKCSQELAGNEALQTKIQNSACRNFAKAFIEYSAAVLDEYKNTLQDILEIINDEGENVQCFWTIAPYLYEELVNSGQSSKEAMKTTLMWAREKDTFLRFGIYGSDSGEYVLGYDERMPSHLLARLLAKQVIQASLS